MANVMAVRPNKIESDKAALPGTLMLKRADVLGLVRKLLHYADTNIATAEEEGRTGDADVQRTRRRVLTTLREGLKTIPMFENPDLVGAIPYSEAEAFIRARANGCALIDIPRTASVDRSPKGEDREDGLHAQHESAVAKPRRPNTTEVSP
jgi:hypothetical protein